MGIGWNYASISEQVQYDSKRAEQFWMMNQYHDTSRSIVGELEKPEYSKFRRVTTVHCC